MVVLSLSIPFSSISFPKDELKKEEDIAGNPFIDNSTVSPVKKYGFSKQ
jgi:hypothetical protein